MLVAGSTAAQGGIHHSLSRSKQLKPYCVKARPRAQLTASMDCLSRVKPCGIAHADHCTRCPRTGQVGACRSTPTATVIHPPKGIRGDGILSYMKPSEVPHLTCAQGLSRAVFVVQYRHSTAVDQRGPPCTPTLSRSGGTLMRLPLDGYASLP